MDKQTERQSGRVKVIACDGSAFLLFSSHAQEKDHVSDVSSEGERSR